MQFASPLIDGFNRADENPLSQGGTWLSLGGGAEQFQVVSMQCVGKSGAGSLSITYRSTTSPDDQEAWVTVATKPGTGDFAALALRVSAGGGSSFNLYEWRFQTAAATDTWVILRVSAGSGTTVKSGSFELADGDQLYARIVGGLVTGQVWRGTTLMLSADYVDSSPLASGAIGLGLSNTVARMDDFGGGSASTPTGTDQLISAPIGSLVRGH